MKFVLFPFFFFFLSLLYFFLSLLLFSLFSFFSYFLFFSWYKFTFDYVHMYTRGNYFTYTIPLFLTLLLTIAYLHTRSSFVLHASPLLIYNHLDAFFADSEITLMAFLFFSIIPKRLRTLHTDLPAKPRQPTSIG